ncbi:MAG TPA: aldose 1-epimerase family protein [Microvirga sp.]|jgi:galactose mutarotase-like enzyme
MKENSAHPIRLVADGATVLVDPLGAEPLAWSAAGRSLLWAGDPAFWDRRAPILFPVVGSSVDGIVRIDGAAYPMPQHGFAKDRLFETVERSAEAVRLRLRADETTRRHYPFSFCLDIALALTPTTFVVTADVVNEGSEPMPYALGFHPGFAWPFDAATRDGHHVAFAADEVPEVPGIVPLVGLLERRLRPIPLADRRLDLSPDLFRGGALIVRDAASRSLRLMGPSGSTITIEAEGFRHWAVWTKPDAGFVCLEALTGHADWTDADGDIAQRNSILWLAPGDTARHRVTMRFDPAT